jgi:hypothetical protein
MKFCVGKLIMIFSLAYLLDIKFCRSLQDLSESMFNFIYLLCDLREKILSGFLDFEDRKN